MLTCEDWPLSGDAAKTRMRWSYFVRQDGGRIKVYSEVIDHAARVPDANVLKGLAKRTRWRSGLEVRGWSFPGGRLEPAVSGVELTGSKLVRAAGRERRMSARSRIPNQRGRDHRKERSHVNDQRGAPKEI